MANPFIQVIKDYKEYMSPDTYKEGLEANKELMNILLDQEDTSELVAIYANETLEHIYEELAQC